MARMDTSGRAMMPVWLRCHEGPGPYESSEEALDAAWVCVQEGFLEEEVLQQRSGVRRNEKGRVSRLGVTWGAKRALLVKKQQGQRTGGGWWESAWCLPRLGRLASRQPRSQLVSSLCSSPAPWGGCPQSRSGVRAEHLELLV